MQKEFQSETALSSPVPSISIPLLKKAGWHSHTYIQDNEYILSDYKYKWICSNRGEREGEKGGGEDGGISFQNLLSVTRKCDYNSAGRSDSDLL